MVSRLKRCGAARGSALSEFVVLLVVMVPLMFGIPMIGKLIDLRQSSVQASRYAAWETTVASASRLPDDVQARFFADERAPVTSTPTTAESHRLWGTPRDGENAQAGMPMQTRVVIDETRAAATPYAGVYAGDVDPGPAHAMGDMIGSVGRLVDDAVGGDWDIEADGLMKGGVSVAFEGNVWLDPATLEETSVIMNDNWSASGDAKASKRARSFVPMGVVGESRVEDMLVLTGRLKPLQELDRLDGAFGRVDMGPLPESERGERRLRDWDELR